MNKILWRIREAELQHAAFSVCKDRTKRQESELLSWGLLLRGADQCFKELALYVYIYRLFFYIIFTY